MPRVKGEDGRFIEEEKKEVLSIKVRSELKQKLRKLPNTSQYIEALIYERMNQMVIVNDDWDYCEQWDILNKIIVMAGRAMETLCQEEYQTFDADERLKFAMEAIARLTNYESNKM